MDGQSFEYRLRARTGILALIVGAAAIGIGAYSLVTGWEIALYTVDLGPEVSRWLAIGAIALGVVLVMGFLAIARAGRRVVTVSPQRIAAPAGETSRRIVVLDPATVSDVRVQTYNGVVTATLVHPRGKLKLRSPHFASGQHFLACLDAIEHARAAARGI